MTEALMASVTGRLRNRADSEHEQAVIRLALSSLILAYLAVTDWLGHESTRSPLLVYTLIGLFLAASLGLLIEIARRPAPCPRRRLLGMVADNAAITTCMYLTTDLGAPLFGVFLFVTFGNGFRYGRAYLFASQAMALAGFCAVLVLNPYWHDQLPLGMGLLFSMVLLPLYVSTLLTRIQGARRAAEAANLEKTRFLSTMSHEMRTPLNGVIGINELLFDTPLSPEQRELLRSSQSSAQLMLSLVNNILDISKIESGRLDVEQADFDLHRLLHDTLRTLEVHAARKKIALHLHADAEVPYQLVGSPVHLRQVLVNLTGNAVKFTDAGSVTVRVSRLPRPGAPLWLRFEVEDTGIGIASDALPRIFERFYQADQSITRVYGGTGLGSAISKQLVELMGGVIGVESEVGKGSLFWFELPFGLGDAAAAPTQLTGLRVNLLANDPAEVAALSASLAGWGVAVDASAGGPELLRSLASAAQLHTPYHVVLVDARAVKMDCVQLAATVRAECYLRAPTLILLNPGAAGRPRDQLLRAGYNAFLETPVDKGAVFNVLHSAIAREDLQVSSTVVPFSSAGRQKRQGTAGAILVAEDNPTNRLVVQKVLEEAGYELTVVENGEEVLDALERRRFDCVVVDWHMPVMGGLEALKLYRVMEPAGAARTPFVMFTANATKEAMDECAAAGFDAFLTKPIAPRRLLETVHRLTSGEQRPGRRPSLAPEDARPAREETGVPEVLDVEKLRELEAIGRSGFVAELVAGFEVDANALVEAMHASAHDADYKGLREQVHALKGSAGSLGANLLYSKCSAVGQVPARDLPVRAEQLVAEIDTALATTREVLREYVSKHLRAAG